MAIRRQILKKHSQSERVIQYNSLWARSGLYLLWNRLFPKLIVNVILPSWSVCNCNISKIIEGINVTIISVVFAHDATVLELEFTTTHGTAGIVRIHPWNTTIDLRKCVSKNLRVSQIQKVPSFELSPGKTERIHTSYREIKLSHRLRWLDIFISIRLENGNFVEDSIRIPYSVLIKSMVKKGTSKLDNIDMQFSNAGLLILYVLSFVIGIIVDFPLRYLGISWYYQLPFFFAVTLFCAIVLKKQYIVALENIGYHERLSIRSLYDYFYLILDSTIRSRERRRTVNKNVHNHLEKSDK